MDISEISGGGKRELILALGNDGSFFEWSRGRLANVDRFLSNFHRPLQRRMLLTDPKVDLPETKVIKLAATGDIFLVGDSRIDSANDTKYNRITVLHSVNTQASDLVDYYNYNFNDPLVSDLNKVNEGQYFISLEYVSSKDIRDGDEAYQARLVAFSPLPTPFKRDGVFILRGKSYKVVQPYFDSGFSCAHLLQQEDDIELLTHKATVSTLYDVTTGTFNKVTIDYYYPGSIDKYKQNNDGSKVFDIYVKYSNPLAKFTVGETISTSQGDVEIVDIIKDTNTQGQWHLICSR